MDGGGVRRIQRPTRGDKLRSLTTYVASRLTRLTRLSPEQEGRSAVSIASEVIVRRGRKLFASRSPCAARASVMLHELSCVGNNVVRLALLGPYHDALNFFECH